MTGVQFEIKQDALSVVQNTVIDANFDECKAALQDMMAPYASLIVTEDAIPAAKTDRASIRKVRERIDQARKTVKGVYTEPLKAFEAKCKELTDICDNASGHIDGQIKAFEAAQKAEKLKRLEEYYKSSVGDMGAYLPWLAVCNDKWGNLTYKEETAQAEITNAIERCQTDVAAIRALGSEHELMLLDYYKQTHDLSKCIRKNEDLKAFAEHERKSREARERMLAERKAAQEQERAAKAEESKVLPFKEPEIDREPPLQIDFRVWVTKDQLFALKDFLNKHQIQYGRVPKEGRYR